MTKQTKQKQNKTKPNAYFIGCYYMKQTDSNILWDQLQYHWWNFSVGPFPNWQLTFIKDRWCHALKLPCLETKQIIFHGHFTHNCSTWFVNCSIYKIYEFNIYQICLYSLTLRVMALQHYKNLLFSSKIYWIMWFPTSGSDDSALN